MDPSRLESATLGGGCFWCLEACFLEMEGVLEVASGYAGGHVEEPSYEEVCGGRTGHAEVVQLRFDPEVVSYRRILEVFFAIHDPTTVDRQGADVGPQYRSVIFTHDESQRKVAADLVGELTAEDVFGAPIVTQVEPLDRFWPAEAYHVDYYRRNSSQPYCQAVISPKLAKFRQLVGIAGGGSTATVPPA